VTAQIYIAAPLPPRRALRRVKVWLKFANVPIQCMLDVGMHPVSGLPLEVFLVSSVGKPGSLIRSVGDDIAVAISHLLQSGHTLAAVIQMFAPGGLAHQVCTIAALIAEDLEHPDLEAFIRPPQPAGA